MGSTALAGVMWESVSRAGTCRRVWLVLRVPAQGLVGSRCHLQQPLHWEDKVKAAPKALETPRIHLPSHPPRVLPPPNVGAIPQACPAGCWHSLCGAMTTHERDREHTTRLPRGQRRELRDRDYSSPSSSCFFPSALSLGAALDAF